jgi:hypothetical protein
MFDIKIGDKVILSRNHGGDKVAVVSGETKLCWKVDGYLFYKEDHRERGGSVWYQNDISEWTQEKEDVIKLKRKCNEIAGRLSSINSYNLPLDKLIRIGEILDENKG